MAEKFFTKIQKGTASNTAGIVVPPEIVAALGKSKKPPVKVTLNSYTYRSTIAVMSGKFMISLSAENRKAAGIEGAEELEIRLEVDSEPRITPIPKDLKTALVKAGVLDAFENAAPSRRKEFVRLVEDAKTPETRERRIAKVLSSVS
jgi:hypothetical protein